MESAVTGTRRHLAAAVVAGRWIPASDGMTPEGIWGMMTRADAPHLPPYGTTGTTLR